MTSDTDARDFDFFLGTWRVRHRRLKARLAQCEDWEEFPGTCETLPLLGGCANIDDNILELPGGTYRAATLRSFDSASGLWAIWWLDGRNPHALDAPMRGRFAGGIGTFLADEVWGGRPIQVRFLWSHAAPDSCRWEQAFSPDGGVNWETNWTMDFTRTA